MQTHSANIDGVEYKLIRLSPFKSSKILTRLSKMGAMPLLRAITALKTEGDDSKSVMDMQVDEILPKVADALEPLFMKLSEDDMENLCMDLLCHEGFTANGKQLATKTAIEMQFGEHGLLHMMKVIKFGLGVNFADFLPVLRGAGKAFQG